MSNRTGILTNNHHALLDDLTVRLVRAVCAGTISEEDAKLKFGHLWGAVDIGNVGEIESWSSFSDEDLLK